MSEAPPYDPTFAAEAVEHGRQGLSRAEIASEFGVTLDALSGWSADQPDFADALRRAETECRAWWDRQPRTALNSRDIFKAGAWRQAMAQRFGASARAQSAEEPIDAPPILRLNIPDNGRGGDDDDEGAAD
jgi:hypothetical protein